ncbi:MAG TPA: hypothetical protein VGV37_26765 [Aliidongia sp.]|uniref:hypothetical protein n=1 Tax=Aliidongia sp. TaxID=1914230 RepID=UPI002DDDB0B4|nr:hypothetical protein [Aliidongia sp.]HEV2678158.1 hypothetical protein [Aliidongia sp.]
MIRSLLSDPIARALTCALLAGLAACQTEAPRPQASGSCLVERADFGAATDRAGLPSDQAGGADGYYAALRRTVQDPGDQARTLSVDLAKDSAAVDHMTSSFATLKSCRLDRAEEIRNGVAGGSLAVAQAAPLLAAERANFESEIAVAQDAARRLGQHEAMLREVADRLAAARPGTDLKVARAAAAAPPPAHFFVATTAAAIYAKPTATASRVANLRRTQRVQGPGGEAAPGWVQLTLNDGSPGYVESAVLRPAQANASALKAAAKAETVREADGDPIAAAALMARVDLPDRQQALTALVDTSTEGLAQAFNPSPPPAADTDPPPAS